MSHRRRPVFQLLLLVFMGAVLAGCSWFGEKQDITKDWSAARLYSAAKERLQNKDYEQAIDYYEKLEARYPFGPHSQQAQLDIAYAYYRNDEAASAVAAADRFIKLHPNHPNVDYVYYLKGLVSFNENLGPLETLTSYMVPWDMSNRDPKAARESYDAFRELVNRFPNSKYTPDSLLRMNYLVNALASHEIHVARHYMKLKAYVAAANRALYVLEHYPATPATEDALVIMVHAYGQLGMTQLQDDAMRVLTQNFPQNPTVTGQTNSTAWWKFW